MTGHRGLQAHRNDMKALKKLVQAPRRLAGQRIAGLPELQACFPFNPYVIRCATRRSENFVC